MTTTTTQNPATQRPTRPNFPTRDSGCSSVIDGRVHQRGRKVGGLAPRSHIIGNCAPNKPVTSLYQMGTIWMAV